MAPPRFHFFGGKGGVGKTTCSAAAAVLAARDGRRVLAVSTDPAHSLGDALAKKLGPRPRRVAGTLDAAELDADAALERWLAERRATLATIAERGTYLDSEDVERFLGLSLPGVDELVGLLELSRLGEGYDEVVVDTAPTGHTLRLLAMPETLRRIATVFDDMQEKHRLVAGSLGGRYRRDRSDALIEEIDHEGRSLAALVRDPSRARFSWVLLPEVLSVEETHDALAALEREGIHVDELVVNRLTPRPRGRCALCSGRVRAEAEAMSRLRTRIPMRFVPSLEEEPRGLAALRKLGRLRNGEMPGTQEPRKKANGFLGSWVPGQPRPKNALALSVPLTTRLLLFGGKGGTGKTTCAAAAALVLARERPESRLLLLSTDPAHSLGDVLDRSVGDEPLRLAKNLDARELDADKAFAEKRDRFREAVDDVFDALRGSSSFDESYDRAVARDLIELAPPGVDELFAIVSVMDLLVPESGEARYDLVVVDTAPAGHALRLLEMPENAQEWVKTLLQVILKYREAVGLGKLTQDLVETSRGLRRLRALLADPAATCFVPVARAAELPRIQTVRLLRSLERLGIAAPLVLANALTPPGCARCNRARKREEKELSRLERAARRDILVASAAAPPPRGAEALEEWGRTWHPL